MKQLKQIESQEGDMISLHDEGGKLLFVLLLAGEDEEWTLYKVEGSNMIPLLESYCRHNLFAYLAAEWDMEVI